MAFATTENANQRCELVVHIVFGTLTAMAFLSSGPRRSEPVCALEKPTMRTAGV